MSAMGDLLRSFATRADSGEDVSAAVAAAFGTVGPPPVVTVTLPRTGHVVPVPVADDMTFWAYLYRAYPDCGGKPGQQSFMRVNAFCDQQSPTLMADRSLWPMLVDKFYNNMAYAGAYAWDEGKSAQGNFDAWVAAGSPVYDSAGRKVDTRGRPIFAGDPHF